MENYVNRPLSDKSTKICIVVVHDLTNDICYNAKMNRSKICYFGVNSKKHMLKIEKKNGKIFVLSIFVDILVLKFCTVVVHILNKDISYHIKVN